MRQLPAVSLSTVGISGTEGGTGSWKQRRPGREERILELLQAQLAQEQEQRVGRVHRTWGARQDEAFQAWSPPGCDERGVLGDSWQLPPPHPAGRRPLAPLALVAKSGRPIPVPETSCRGRLHKATSPLTNAVRPKKPKTIATCCRVTTTPPAQGHSGNAGPGCAADRSLTCLTCQG